jgi:hypothetical protein
MGVGQFHRGHFIFPVKVKVPWRIEKEASFSEDQVRTLC